MRSPQCRPWPRERVTEWQVGRVGPNIMNGRSFRTRNRRAVDRVLIYYSSGSASNEPRRSLTRRLKVALPGLRPVVLLLGHISVVHGVIRANSSIGLEYRRQRSTTLHTPPLGNCLRRSPPVYTQSRLPQHQATRPSPGDPSERQRVVVGPLKETYLVHVWLERNSSSAPLY